MRRDARKNCKHDKRGRNSDFYKKESLAKKMMKFKMISYNLKTLRGLLYSRVRRI